MNICPVCDTNRITPFLLRPQVPTHQNLVVTSLNSARDIARGVLDMAVCNTCGFVYNRAFEPSRLEYGADYYNTQSCSPFFDEYLTNLSRYLVKDKGITNKVIVEVGCGKGHFLQKLINYPGANNKGLGFDPSYVGPEITCDGKLTFYRRYYGPDCADFSADVIICRHVIEHVPNPKLLLQSIKQALTKSPNARVFFETPCVDWILSHKIAWDFFYEHCSLFSKGSLTTAFQSAGFTVELVKKVFGEQYLWLEAVPTSSSHKIVMPPEDTPAMAKAYGDSEVIRQADWLARLDALSSKGPIALWGAGAKGATFANLIDPSCRLIDCVVDVNPNKQGKYLPGTGHPIVDYRALPVRGVHNVILMNPNYRAENEQMLANAGIFANLIDWS